MKDVFLKPMEILKKQNLLFIILGALFLANALLAEFIGVKIFSLENSLGYPSLNLSLFGFDNLSFSLTAGVLLWPVVFTLTDIINEYYGVKGVRVMSFIAAGVIAYAFVMVYFSIHLKPADFWVTTKSNNNVPNMQSAFASIFGQGNWIIVGSLAAFLIGQFVDVFIFHKVKKITGDKAIWLRATGSTLVSQLVDSFVVLFIAFYLGANWDIRLVLAICTINYLYKFLMALIMTPILYLVHYIIDNYLGKELSRKMMDEAAA